MTITLTINEANLLWKGFMSQLKEEEQDSMKLLFATLPQKLSKTENGKSFPGEKWYQELYYAIQNGRIIKLDPKLLKIIRDRTDSEDLKALINKLLSGKTELYDKKFEAIRGEWLVYNWMNRGTHENPKFIIKRGLMKFSNPVGRICEVNYDDKYYGQTIGWARLNENMIESHFDNGSSRSTIYMEFSDFNNVGAIGSIDLFRGIFLVNHHGVMVSSYKIFLRARAMNTDDIGVAEYDSFDQLSDIEKGFLENVPEIRTLHSVLLFNKRL